MRHHGNKTQKYVNMADINVSVPVATAEARHRAEPVWDLIELLFFAYRDFVGDADEVLAKFGFGRAHHRVLHFVNRNPGMKVAELLGILKITKQSLGRVLKQLIDEGYVEQKEGATDRRQRLLFVTPKGEALALRLAGLQSARIGRALAESRLRRSRHGAALPDRDARPRPARRRAAPDRRRRPRAPPGVVRHAMAPLASAAASRQCAPSPRGRRRPPHSRSACRASCAAKATASPPPTPPPTPAPSSTG